MGKVNTRDRRGHFSFGSLGWFPSCFANPRPLPGHDGISPSLSYAVDTGGCQGRFDSPFAPLAFCPHAPARQHHLRLPGTPRTDCPFLLAFSSLSRILIPLVRHVEKRQAQVSLARRTRRKKTRGCATSLSRLRSFPTFSRLSGSRRRAVARVGKESEGRTCPQIAP